MRPSAPDAWRASVADESSVRPQCARWPGPPRRAKLAASVVLDLSEGDNEETASSRAQTCGAPPWQRRALAGWSAASLASASKDN
eukprot:scaffold22701_cov74-Phaeocystis_antarctica.AAC.2